MAHPLVAGRRSAVPLPCLPHTGGERNYLGTCGQNFRFAGMEYDSETTPASYRTLFRQYTTNYGRWLSPDRLGGDITNPQSVNRYAYVMNNPLSNIDPSGQACYGIERARGGGCDAFIGANADWYISAMEGLGGCTMDGVDMPCSITLAALESGAAVQCPSNGCSPIFGEDPYTGNQTWLFFTAGAGGATGYLSIYDWTQGVNEVNGTFLSNAAFQAYLRENFLDAINAQLAAVINALEDRGVSESDIRTFENYAGEHFSQIDIEGGNANFSSSGTTASDRYFNFGNFGCPGGRCDEGALGTLDFSHNNGMFHLDTADPHSGFWGALVHFGVDLILGNTAYWVLPR